MLGFCFPPFIDPPDEYGYNPCNITIPASDNPLMGRGKYRNHLIYNDNLASAVMSLIVTALHWGPTTDMN